MREIIVDDNAEFARILSRTINVYDEVLIYTEEHHNTPKNNTKIKKIGTGVQALAEDIIRSSEKISILFINIDLKIGNEKRQFQKGVELLTWLRLKNFNVHCVLYSFVTAHQLLKLQPKNTILFSKGTSFIQLPRDFKRLKYDSLKKEVAEKENLKQCLKGTFDIQQFRHRDANWWGVIQLVDVHRSLFPEELRFKDDKGKSIDYPIQIINRIDDLNNRYALFLHGDTDFLGAMDTVLRESLERELRKLKHEIELSERRLTISNKKNPKPDDLMDYRQDRLRLIEEKKNDQQWVVEYMSIFENQVMETDSKIEKLKICLQNHTNRKKQVEEILIKPPSRAIDANICSDEINRLRYTRIEDRKPHIIQIDDQAVEGWSDIIQYMIYGELRPKEFIVPDFRSFLNSSDGIEKKLEDIFTLLVQLMNQGGSHLSYDLDVILLDLRLIPEYDREMKQDVENMSGALLLKKIRSEFPGIPVIITTASNKIWTYEELMQLGADGYWIKEGLDEQRTVEDTVRNYKRFLELVNKVVSREYQDLKILANKIHELWTNHQNGIKFWWENHKWNFEYYVLQNGRCSLIIPNDTKVDREIISDILNDALNTLRQYYHTTLMGYGYNTFSGNEWSIDSQIIQHLSKIIEVIHDFESIRLSVGFQNISSKHSGEESWLESKEYDSSRTINGFRGQRWWNRRSDKIGYKLYGVRNEASHFSGAKELKYDDMIDFFKKILNYLETVPQTNNPQLIQRFEKNKKVYDSETNGKEVEN